MLYKVAVLDDDKMSAYAISQMIKECPQAESLHVTTFNDFKSLLKSIAHGERYDIALMDIQLAQGDPDGISVVKMLFPSSSETQVIYVTGLNNVHSKVYQTSHVSFLPKPVMQADLNEAIDRAFDKINQSMERPLCIHVGHSERLIRPKDIVYVESNNRVVDIHLHKMPPFEKTPALLPAEDEHDADKVTAYLKLSEIARMLPDRFAQIHQSYLVNLDYVSDLGPKTVTLENGLSLPISRSHSIGLRRKFFRYARNCMR